MADISVVWNAVDFRGDWGFSTGDLLIDPGGIRSSVLLSLFTWGRAPIGYTPPAGSPTSRYGHWSDTYEPRPIGSLIWTLMRAKKVNDLDLPNRLRSIIENSLQWILDDGIAQTINVTTGWTQPDKLGARIELIRPGGEPERFEFDWAWQGTVQGPGTPPVGEQAHIPRVEREDGLGFWTWGFGNQVAWG